jgi:RNA polymerase sporulation-specific sigma factor
LSEEGQKKKQDEIYELVKSARKGNEQSFEALAIIVKPEVEKLQRQSNLWVFGYEDKDIEQECNFMLLKAIKNYNPERCKNFRFYARILFKGRIVSLIQESKRHKNITLNLCSSLDDKVFQDDDGNDYSLYDLIPESDELLAERVEKSDYFNRLKEVIYEYLTEMERLIFDLYLEDYSYAHISKIVGCPTKSVDNAIQRAKNKLPTIMQEEIKNREKESGKTLTQKRKYTRKTPKQPVGRPKKLKKPIVPKKKYDIVKKQQGKKK